MTVWALSDPHLAFSTPSKSMTLFGPKWENYAEKIEERWRKTVSPGDLVLLPGDISWAMRLEEALIDLRFLDSLPGHKLILRGNHDYWWPSNAKLEKALPPSISFIHNNTFIWKEIGFAGSRLWDTGEYSFHRFVEFQENPNAKQKISSPDEDKKEAEKIFARELQRLEISLQQLPASVTKRIALTHYPPIGADLAPSKASALLEKYQIELCVFGHLHSIRDGSLPFGTARGVTYLFTSCDYLDFWPLKVL